MKTAIFRHGIVTLLLIAVLALLAACTPTEEGETENTAFEGPPQVRIISPQPDAIYLKDASVVISTRIENAGPDISTVSLMINGVNIGTTDASDQTAAAFSIETSWPATTPGDYTLEVVAIRDDGTASDPSSVNFSVQGEVQPQVTDTPTEDASGSTSTNTQTNNGGTSSTTNQQAATATTAPTATQSQPSPVPPSSIPPTASFPTATTLQGANIRSGPGVAYEPPLGSVAAGESFRILARNPEPSADRAWFRIEVFNSSGWIAGWLVQVNGDISSLPVENPAPPPPTNTPAPTATSVPVAEVDLSIVDWSTNPAQPSCLQTATTSITVANSGTSPSTQTNVVLQDLHNGSQQAVSSATIPPLQPGENVTVQIQLTVSTFFAETHTYRATVDPDNGVAEIHEDNNSRQFDYQLQQGGC
ncbi:MAG: SH3 domain-containing protein [Anaerolineaceae bacterium]|nr:SH3 domain-containing protein [Anaerolineaceae bacterium]